MTIDDYIKWANKEIDKNESYIQAADGLPGLYYDAEEVKGYEKNIEHYKQLVEYLEDYKKLKQEPCEDAVNREKVMNVLGDSINDDKDYHRAVVLLNNLPSVIPKEKTGWIPVSERLPEDGQEILFSTKTGRVHSGKYHNDDSANQWYSHRDKCRAWNNVVTAWMSLPKPYEQQESEDDAKIDCSKTKCENCTNHNYCDFES